MSAPRDVPPIVPAPAQTCGRGPAVVCVKLDLAQQKFTAIGGQPIQLLGYRTEDWLSPGFWADCIHPADRIWVIEHCLTEADAGRGHDIEYRMTDRKGEEVWVSQVCSIDRSSAMSKGLGLSGHLVDVTEHLARRADQARASVLRQELLEMIDADLYQPVNAVSSYARLLERHLASQDDDVGSDYAVSMRDGIETLSKAIARLRAAIQCETAGMEAMLAALTAEEDEAKPSHRIAGRTDARQSLLSRR